MNYTLLAEERLHRLQQESLIDLSNQKNIIRLATEANLDEIKKEKSGSFSGEI